MELVPINRLRTVLKILTFRSSSNADSIKNVHVIALMDPSFVFDRPFAAFAALRCSTPTFCQHKQMKFLKRQKKVGRRIQALAVVVFGDAGLKEIALFGYLFIVIIFSFRLRLLTLWLNSPAVSAVELFTRCGSSVGAHKSSKCDCKSQKAIWNQKQQPKSESFYPRDFSRQPCCGQRRKTPPTTAHQRKPRAHKKKLHDKSRTSLNHVHCTKRARETERRRA